MSQTVALCCVCGASNCSLLELLGTGAALNEQVMNGRMGRLIGG